MSPEKRFVVDKKNYKFELYLGDDLVVKSGFSIEPPDKWFNKKYVTLFNFETIEEFRGKGFAKCLLEKIFDYVKNKLKLDIITLNVHKNNHRAINLYLKCGFEKYQDFKESYYYTLIKKL